VALDIEDQAWADAMLADLADQYAELVDGQSDAEVADAMATAFVDELEYRAAHGEERALRVMRAQIAEGLAMLVQTILDERDAGMDVAELNRDEVQALIKEAERRFASAGSQTRLACSAN
jgi:hypothetical protein